MKIDMKMIHIQKIKKSITNELNIFSDYITNTIILQSHKIVNRNNAVWKQIRDAVVYVFVYTLLIALLRWLLRQILPHSTVNISFLYLLGIIWLASTSRQFSSGLMSVLAFLTYDFFFIKPYYLLTIDDPSEWIFLSTFLMISLIITFFASALHKREQYAVDSQMRTAALYDLSQQIAAVHESSTLFPIVTAWICKQFDKEGILACSLWIPTETGDLAIRSIAYSQQNQNPTLAQFDALHYQKNAATSLVSTKQTRMIEQDLSTYFIPLRNQCGILMVSGTPMIEQLLTFVPELDTRQTLPAKQFATICDQIALAIERAALQNEAMHAATLRESERLKDALLGSITHDLRTPITAIQTAASSLTQTDINIDKTSYIILIEKIMGSSRRLENIVANILTISRYEGKAKAAPRSLYPINDVVATALDELDTSGQLQDHRIVIDIAEDPLEAIMDHVAIERVVINLVENAVKYSPPKSKITIKAVSNTESQVIIVQIYDEGVGIPPTELQAIFKKFYRLDQELPWLPEKIAKGTGLGLAACLNIIQEHQGKIWAENLPNNGSVFNFTLPVK